MEKVEKVGVHELMAIPSGESRTFVLPTGAARASAQAQAYKQPLLNPRNDVERYACKSLKPTEEGFPLEITAVAK